MELRAQSCFDCFFQRMAKRQTTAAVKAVESVNDDHDDSP